MHTDTQGRMVLRRRAVVQVASLELLCQSFQLLERLAPYYLVEELTQLAEAVTTKVKNGVRNTMAIPAPKSPQRSQKGVDVRFEAREL